MIAEIANFSFFGSSYSNLPGVCDTDRLIERGTH